MHGTYSCVQVDIGELDNLVRSFCMCIQIATFNGDCYCASAAVRYLWCEHS